jgi:tetratricopeptide (TPR) repeat protein
MSSTWAAGAVAGCLASDPYKNIDTTYEQCDVALRVQGLDAKTRAKLLLMRGKALSAADRFDSAIADYSEAVNLDATLNEARRKRAWAYLNKGDLETAYDQFIAALAEEGNAADSLYGIGWLMNRWERFDEAEKAYRQSIAADPEYFLAREALAYLLGYRKQDFDASIAAYNEILAYGREKLDSTEFRNTNALGTKSYYDLVVLAKAEILQMAGRTIEARAEYLGLRSRYPKSYVPIAGLATVELNAGKYEEALVRAKTGLELCITLASGYYCPEVANTAFSAAWSLQRYEDVKTTAEAIIKLSIPEFQKSEAHYMRALYYKKLGRTEAAKADFISAIACSECLRHVVAQKLEENGYYESNVPDADGQHLINGLDACLLDPECLS